MSRLKPETIRTFQDALERARAELAELKEEQKAKNARIRALQYTIKQLALLLEEKPRPKAHERRKKTHAPTVK